MPNSSPVYLEVDDILAVGAEQQSRRKSQVGRQEFNYTNRAILSFLEAVSKMNDEVLVPSKLRDIDVRESEATELMPANSDLYSFFQILNSVKQDLFSSTHYFKAFQPVASQTNSGQNSGRVTPISISRRSSSVALQSMNSVTNGTNNGRTLLSPNSMFERRLSCSPSFNSGDISPDALSTGTLSPSLSLPSTYMNRTASLSTLLTAIGLDNDNGNESLTTEERVQQITACFMHHLTALYTILGHFTRGANYILKRYKEETGNF